MEIIRGKMSLEMDAGTLSTSISGCRHVLIDLGTGDGRFVRRQAEQHPAAFVIGVDACRENLRVVSRAKLPNALFVIANAQSLPAGLYGLATQVTINFPWGSLLEGLLQAEHGLMAGLSAVSRPGTLLEVRLNAGALAEAGTSLEKGTALVRDNLLSHGFGLRAPAMLDINNLRNYPTTWSRRLAVGRDPRSVALSGARLALNNTSV